LTPAAIGRICAQIFQFCVVTQTTHHQVGRTVARRGQYSSDFANSWPTSLVQLNLATSGRA
jgi:hypothetical protein